MQQQNLRNQTPLVSPFYDLLRIETSCIILLNNFLFSLIDSDWYLDMHIPLTNKLMYSEPIIIFLPQKRNLFILVIQKYLTRDIEWEQNWFYEIWNAHHHQHLCLFIIRLVTSIDVFIVVIILKEIIYDEQVRKLPIDNVNRIWRLQFNCVYYFFDLMFSRAKLVWSKFRLTKNTI